MTHFENADRAIAGVEDGYVNDPQDPGGETKYGITKRDHPTVDIKNLTLEEAQQIRHGGYWVPAHCDDMPWPLCLLVYDCAINQGPDAAVKLLQKALGTTIDGILGKNTLVALARTDQKELCAMFMARRALRYIGTRNFDTYGVGWFKRLFVIALDAEVEN